MKKSILFTALAALLLATSCAGSDTTSEETVTPAKKTAPKREGWGDWHGPLYGDVESVTITEYKLSEKFGEIVKDKIDYKEVYKFNQNGDVVEMAAYNSDGSLYENWLCKYDSQGKLIEVAGYYPDGSLDDKSLYKYDSRGNQIEEAHYNSDGSLDRKHLSKYDSQGNMVEEARYFDGSLRSTTIYKYDAQGNRIEHAIYDSDGSLDSKELSKYDSQGNKIEEVEYKSDGSLRSKHLYKYDSQGKLIEKAEYNSDGSLDEKWLCKYDSQGNIEREWIKYDLDGSIIFRNLSKYDTQGKLIEEELYGRDGRTFPIGEYSSRGYQFSGYSAMGNIIERIYLVKYDTHNNLIGKITCNIETMKPTSVTVREIVYRK